MILKKDYMYTLSELKDLVQSFTTKQIFVPVRMGFKFVCNRADRYGPKYLKKPKRSRSKSSI